VVFLAQSQRISFEWDSGVALVLIAVWIGFLVLYIAAFVKIISKAGYSGWWVLVGIVPILNVIMFFVFAFSDWPVLQELRQLRSGGTTTAPSGPFSAPPPTPPPPLP
jgi:hypothetical protein